MASENSRLVPVYRLISRKLERLEKTIGREKHFGQCLQNKVCPRTLVVKPPAHYSTVNAIAQNSYKNAAFAASMKNLQIAYKDSKFDYING